MVLLPLHISHSVVTVEVKVLKKEVEIQQIKEKEKESYAEAAKMTGQKKLNREGSYNKEQVAAKKQQDKKNAWIEKKKMVTFIAGIINT